MLRSFRLKKIGTHIWLIHSALETKTTLGDSFETFSTVRCCESFLHSYAGPSVDGLIGLTDWLSAYRSKNSTYSRLRVCRYLYVSYIRLKVCLARTAPHFPPPTRLSNWTPSHLLSLQKTEHEHKNTDHQAPSPCSTDDKCYSCKKIDGAEGKSGVKEGLGDADDRCQCKDSAFSISGNQCV